MGAIAGGWTLGAVFTKHTGFSFTPLIGSCDTNHDLNGDGACPDMPIVYAGGKIANPSKQDWQNGVFTSIAASFPGSTTVPPASHGPGCRCRNIFEGPGFTQLDLSFGKNFLLPNSRVLGENAKLEFRSNFFNALNILNLESLAPATAPTDVVNAGQFGRPLDGLSGRVIEFQLRLSF